MNYPKITKIIETKKENKNVKTIKFKHSKNVNPGQFYMIWIPDTDEIPMSVSHIDKNIKGITFKKVGEATESLFNLKKGDKIGIRGPFGNGFKIFGQKILFVGGGTGIAMIAPAVKIAVNQGISVDVILGFKKEDEIFFDKRINDYGANVYVCTDDGSKCFKGFATDMAKKMIDKTSYDLVLTCGPEIMMKKLYEICKDISFQASLERHMKCGIGLCGQCCVGRGLRVCVEGPVFDGDILKKIPDFGVFKRDASGKKIKI